MFFSRYGKTAALRVRREGQAVEIGVPRFVVYQRWYSMLDYHRDEVCPEWRTFAGFLADMPAMPRADAVLVRLDRTKPYGPANVRWGEERERRQMSKHVFLIRYQGKEQSITAWADELGIDRCSLSKRLRWLPPEKALKLPKRFRPRRPRKPKSPFASSRYVGVGRHSTCDRWEARIRVRGRPVYLGLHPTERLAANAIASYRAEAAAKKKARRIRDMVRRGAGLEKLFDELQELILAARAVTDSRALSRRLLEAWKFGEPADTTRPMVEENRGLHRA